MPVKCVCLPANDPRVKALKEKCCRPTPCVEDVRTVNTKIDLCNIWNRTQDTINRHKDYDCHLKGERRQNIINKLRMFLDGIDDRPVIIGNGGGKGTGSANGRPGFGCVIRYPGYVDYTHPYFREPFDRMPGVAVSVGNQTGGNPCPPICVTVPPKKIEGGKGGQNSSGGSSPCGPCQCARRRKDCPPNLNVSYFPTPCPPEEKYVNRKEMECQCVCEPILGSPAPVSTPTPTHYGHNKNMYYCCYPLPK